MAKSGFVSGVVKRLFVGPPVYYAWVLILLAVAGVGIIAYTKQLQTGLIVTGMTNYVSWGLYIGNFTFCVGVAAAAVLLIIPAYLYDFGPIKEVVVSNTIPFKRFDQCPKIKVLDMAPLLAEAIERIHLEKTVSALFV